MMNNFATDLSHHLIKVKSGSWCKTS